MNTSIRFRVDPQLLQELEAFFTARGIQSEIEGEENIIRATEPSPDHPPRRRDRWIAFYGKTADVAKAWIKYLESKGPEFSLSFESSETSTEVSETIQVSKLDDSKKLERFFQKKKKGPCFHAKLKL
jgi:hypothetical protein